MLAFTEMSYENLLICASSFMPLTATVIETYSIREIAPLVEQEMWVLVDLDNTLFQAKQSLGHADWFYHEVKRLLDQGLSREEAIAKVYPQWIKTQEKCPVMPIEEAFIELIKEWQLNGICVMGLTHRQPSVAASTSKQIRSLGLDFSLTAPVSSSFSINADSPTLYQDGVLFVGDYEKKGVIFKRFLKKIGSSPNKVLFLDDKLVHVQEVQAALQSDGIVVFAVHYRAIERTPKVFAPELAEIQFRHFDQSLSNEAAMAFLEQN